MRNQTVTRALESDLEANEIYDVLAEASNIPKWAPVFADRIEQIDDTHYIVTKGSATFKIRVVLHRSAGTVDLVRELGNNRRGGVYLRVTSRPLGGSTVTMTVPVGANANELDVAGTVDQELAEVIRLAQPQVSKL